MSFQLLTITAALLATLMATSTLAAPASEDCFDTCIVSLAPEADYENNYWLKRFCAIHCLRDVAEEIYMAGKNDPGNYHRP